MVSGCMMSRALECSRSFAQRNCGHRCRNGSVHCNATGLSVPRPHAGNGDAIASAIGLDSFMSIAHTHSAWSLSVLAWPSSFIIAQRAAPIRYKLAKYGCAATLHLSIISIIHVARLRSPLASTDGAPRLGPCRHVIPAAAQGQSRLDPSLRSAGRRCPRRLAGATRSLVSIIALSVHSHFRWASIGHGNILIESPAVRENVLVHLAWVRRGRHGAVISVTVLTLHGRNGTMVSPQAVGIVPPRWPRWPRPPRRGFPHKHLSILRPSAGASDAPSSFGIGVSVSVLPWEVPTRDPHQGLASRWRGRPATRRR